MLWAPWDKLCLVGGWDKYSSMLWAEIHLCWSVHGTGRVCSGSAGSRSKCALTSILEPQETLPPGSGPPSVGRPVHRFGCVSPASAGSRSRSSDMDTGKPAFMSGTARPASSTLRGPSSQVLTLLGGARIITLRLRHLILGECQRGRRHFWSRKADLGSGHVDAPT